jgi:hypothetical protein
MEEQPTDGTDAEVFERKVLDVREAFGDWLAGLLVDGRIADKEKLERDKLKITVRLVNFVAFGGVLLFRGARPAGTRDDSTGGLADGPDGGGPLDEASFFRLLLRTILLMLNGLNQPDVNLLKISLAPSFRAHLQAVFSSGDSGPDRFPVKICQDIHPDGSAFVGINLRNTRSLGEDLDRIERDPSLRARITGRLRLVRHTDGALRRFFVHPDPV